MDETATPDRGQAVKRLLSSALLATVAGLGIGLMLVVVWEACR